MNLPEETQISLRRAVRLAQLLSLFLLVSIFLFPMAVMTTLGRTPQSGTWIDLPDWALWAAAAWGLLFLVFAPRAAQLVVERGAREKVSGAAAVRIWLASVIIAMILREACATVGLVLSIVTQDLKWSLILGLFAFFSIGRNWPRYGS